MMKLSDILKDHGDTGSTLTVKELVHTDEGVEEKYVLIEGDGEALRFLARTILAIVEEDEHCNLSLHPASAGSAHFSKTSQLGLYIHVLPCKMSPGHVIANS